MASDSHFLALPLDPALLILVGQLTTISRLHFTINFVENHQKLGERAMLTWNHESVEPNEDMFGFPR